MVGVQRIKANELNSFVNSQDVTDQINLDNSKEIQKELKRKSEAMKEAAIGCCNGLFASEGSIECEETERAVIFRCGEILTTEKHADEEGC